MTKNEHQYIEPLVADWQDNENEKSTDTGREHGNFC